MADQPGKAKAPKYELVVNETGAMRRVPTGTAPAPVVRTAIASAALASVRPPEPEEEGLVFEDEAPVAAVPAPTAPKTAAKPRRPKRVLDWATLPESEKVQQFYKYRAKHPQFFVYTAEGNLLIKENNPLQIPPGTLTLRAFSSLRPEELEELETQRTDRQADAEEKYVLKLKELRTAYDQYQAVPQDAALEAEVVKLNEAVRQMSVLRNRALYPEQWISTVDNPQVRTVLYSQPHEERKFGYDVYLYKRSPLSFKDVEGHYRAHGEGVGTGQAGGASVVLFLTDVEDPQTGQFHPATETEFVFNETKYASPYQAYEAERFKELGEEDILQKLLGTRSARTIKQLVSQESRPAKQPLVLWQDILEALYTQHKPLAEALLATGSARFHLMDKQIGTPEYANALVSVRTKLKEREDQAPVGMGEVKQSVITKEQQDKAKVGAIINNFRRH